MTHEAKKPTDEEVREEMERDTDAGAIKEEIREEKDRGAKPSAVSKEPN